MLKFNEETGDQLTSQVQFPVDAEASKQPPVILPWRHWRAHNRNVGEVAADQASAVAVLHGIHSLVDLIDQEVDVMQEDGHISVVARTAISEKTLSLPPCVPRTPKVYDKSEHPYMAHIQVQVLDNYPPKYN